MLAWFAIHVTQLNEYFFRNISARTHLVSRGGRKEPVPHDAASLCVDSQSLGQTGGELDVIQKLQKGSRQGMMSQTQAFDQQAGTIQITGGDVMLVGREIVGVGLRVPVLHSGECSPSGHPS